MTTYVNEFDKLTQKLDKYKQNLQVVNKTVFTSIIDIRDITKNQKLYYSFAKVKHNTELNDLIIKLFIEYKTKFSLSCKKFDRWFKNNDDYEDIKDLELFVLELYLLINYFQEKDKIIYETKVKKYKQLIKDYKTKYSIKIKYVPLETDNFYNGSNSDFDSDS